LVETGRRLKSEEDVQGPRVPRISFLTVCDRAPRKLRRIVEEMCIGSDREAEVFFLFKIPRCLRETIYSHTKRVNGEEVLLRCSEASARNVRNSRTGVEEI
jgi:hypothetical protein